MSRVPGAAIGRGRAATETGAGPTPGASAAAAPSRTRPVAAAAGKPAPAPARSASGSTTASVRPAGRGGTAGTAAASATAPPPDAPAPKSDRISVARLDPHKFSDPFATKKKALTVFSTMYQAGAIPCRINHGSVRCYLQWDRPLTELDYASVLQACAEGIRETEHPFVFVARQAFKELLEAESGAEKAVALVPKLVLSLRSALQSAAPGVFEAGLDAVQQLSAAVGPALTAHVHHVLVQINKRLYDKKLRDRVVATLECLERNGGPDALAAIKAKVPSYSSCMA